MNAGLSAIKMGFRLWGRHLAVWVKWSGTVAAAVLVAAWLGFGAFLGALLLALGTGMLMLSVTGLRCPQDARRWFQGGFGERRTARRLAGARRLGVLRGWWFAHDLKIPKSRANLDHVAVHPSGRLVVYLDTKAWHAKRAVVRVDGARLMYGPWDKTKALDTIAWEASRLREGLGGAVTVVSVLVCDGTEVEGGILELDGMWITSSADLPRTLRSITRAQRNKTEARHVRELVEARFPRK